MTGVTQDSPGFCVCCWVPGQQELLVSAKYVKSVAKALPEDPGVLMHLQNKVKTMMEKKWYVRQLE